jgi:hypothetical protein
MESNFAYVNPNICILRMRIYPLSIFSESGGKYLVLLVFIHYFWIPFQNKVRMRINLLAVAR